MSASTSAPRTRAAFYLADVTHGVAKHLSVAVVYPDKASDMTSFSKVGDRLLATARVRATTS